jgi:two-component sensor histidine kinase
MRSHAKEGIRLDLKVESNVAMPIELVVNEIMTNAFNYAFSGWESGTVPVHCLRQAMHWRARGNNQVKTEIHRVADRMITPVS